MRTGKFIVFEGPDGAGKSTVLQEITSKLQQTGVSYLTTREPGGTREGQLLRELLLRTDYEWCGEAEAFLYCADRVQHVRRLILPALAEGKIVLSDRYYYSTLAYQGYGRGWNLTFLRQINQMATLGVEPDLVFLFDIEPELGLSRVKKNRQGQAPDRLEQEELAFHQRVRQGYLELAREQNWEIIDGSRDLAEVVDAVWQILQQRMRENENI